MGKFLFTGDWHLRSDQPPCRNDNFQELQKLVIEQIKDIVIKEKAILIIAGDIFQRSKELMPDIIIYLLYIAREIYKKTHNFVYLVIGNHDCAFHNKDDIRDSNLGILLESGYYKLLSGDPLNIYNMNIYGYDYEQKIKDPSTLIDICVLHKYTDLKVPYYLKDKGIDVEQLCKYNFNIFVTGDNHDGFIYENKKTSQLVFNTGCITRQNIKKKNYRPFVILYDTIKNEYKKRYLIDNDSSVVNIVTTEKLQLERETRIGSFIEVVNSKEGIYFDFEDDVKNKLIKNKIKKEVCIEINNIFEEIKMKEN